MHYKQFSVLATLIYHVCKCHVFILVLIGLVVNAQYSVLYRELQFIISAGIRKKKKQNKTKVRIKNRCIILNPKEADSTF